MMQTKLAKILFLENRSITDVWTGVAGLIMADFNCQLLRFNHSFGESFPGTVVDLVVESQPAHAIDPNLESFIQTVFKTDRAAYLHGASELEIRNVILSVLETLKQMKFDVVIGEVTSVYERAVEFYCRNNNIVFLAPMTSRIPPDRFFFLDGSFMFPLPIVAVPYDKNLLSDAVAKAQSNAGKNDLAMIPDRNIRLRNTLRTLSGWWKGERLHTPSPLRKISLHWERVRARYQLASMPLASIEEIDKSSVIYCMHVQPESTLDNYSPDFWDQAKVVHVIAEACKIEKRPFFVRPHPRFKHEISLHMPEIQTSGVKILSPQVSMQEVLRCRPTIVTVSGTVLLEAAAAGAPTIALDQSYLSSFPGVLHVSLANFGKVLSGEIVAMHATAESQREWFESVNRFSHQGLISPPEWSREALSRQNLIDIAAGVSLAVSWCLQHPRRLP